MEKEMGNGLSQERAGRITGSRIGAVLGLQGAFKSRNAIMQEMVKEYYGELEESTSPDMQRGIDLEPQILEHLNGLFRTKIEQVGFLKHKQYDFLGATPDGFCINNEGARVAVEIKAPREFKELSESYNAQMQLEMEVLDADFGVFVQGVMVKGKLEIKSEVIKRDKDFIKDNLPELEAFMQDFEKAKENHCDLELEVLSREFVALSAQAKEIQDKLNVAKERLIARGAFKNDFVSVIEKTRKGGFDYAKYCKDSKLEIPAQYQKSDTRYFEVRINE